MVSGVVGSNNRRRLDPEEFRGFALAEPLAPLVFVNGADTKAAQMFTLAHELAHVWLGETAVSDARAVDTPRDAVELWCNQVAAELLVPLASLREAYDRSAALDTEVNRLARRFKVSSLAILRRLHDIGALSRRQFWDLYEAELQRLLAIPRTSGGDFYRSLGVRAGKTFARALVISTLEGRTSFTEAFRLLGFRKMATFRELGQSIGVGFWDWLVTQNGAGLVFSIEKVGDEVQAVGAELSVWASARGDAFFLKPDPAVFPPSRRSALGPADSATNRPP